MYSVHLPNFDGPFDLLLYFIERDELDIRDIPIASIARDFLDYVRLMQLFDLELAGDFLVMAATLMQIKAKILLPASANDTPETSEDDPRAELAQRLMTYRIFKEAAKNLGVRAEEHRYELYRRMFDGEQRHLPYGDSLKNATLFDLIRALQKAIARAPREIPPHIVQSREVTVEDRIEEIRTMLAAHRSISFFRLVESLPRSYIVATFLAVLDMVKSGLVRIIQHNYTEDILIERPESD
ncbi:segregation/condensation protein A [Ignavibacteria bacterium]